MSLSSVLFRALIEPSSLRYALMKKEPYEGETDEAAAQAMMRARMEDEMTRGIGIASGIVAGATAFMILVVVLIWVVSFVALWMAWKCKDKTVHLLTAWYNPIAYIILRLFIKCP